VASIALPLSLLVRAGRAIDFEQSVDGIQRTTLSLEPIMQTLEFGQVNLVLMALVAADCLAGHPRWPRGSWSVSPRRSS
jgi:alpha-1,2-mannosyltransferase